MDENTMTTQGSAGARVGALVSVPRSGLPERLRATVRARVIAALSGDAGMSTVEYAVGTIAAAAFGAVLYTVVSGDSIPQALSGIIQRALTTSV